ncbi:hypothetical protein CF131_16275 [Aeromonas dhakensis]|nr:hypothetical protein CF131_16275 [Aeromonas dhakensis]
MAKAYQKTTHQKLYIWESKCFKSLRALNLKLILELQEKLQDSISYVVLNRRLVLNEVKPNVYREHLIKAIIG